MTIRVRFAPSPTGALHIGGLRGALYNYYFARQNKGSFLIRIEDTDTQRNREEFTQAIFDAFSWCGISSDETVVYQSQRRSLYDTYINQLIASGNAYYEETEDDTGKKGKVIKCRVPKERKTIEFIDAIRGQIAFPLSEFDDFIIVRSDGSPLYNLVVVIDDIDMGITHVIRGEEHLPNTPKQILLYEALEKTIPTFAHLPLILGQDRKKLSKRHAATSVIDYKYAGFLPEALCMYLLRLGWSHKDQEIFTYEEILKYFRLEDVHLAPAIFDKDKLMSINNYFIKNASNSYLYEKINELVPNSFNAPEKVIDEEIIELWKPRSKTLLEICEGILLVKNNPQRIALEKNTQEEFDRIIRLLQQYLVASHPIEKFFQEETLAQFPKSTIYKAIRWAVLGVLESPSIMTILNILGPEEVLRRITPTASFQS